jgi:hypothetical protein
MNLHPDDARIVLEKKFGERHPLARGGWLKAYVPREFTSKCRSQFVFRFDYPHPVLLFYEMARALSL